MLNVTLPPFLRYTQYVRPLDRLRAQFIAAVQIFLMVVLALYAVLVPEWYLAEVSPTAPRVILLESAFARLDSLILLLIPYVLGAVTLWLLPRQRLFEAGVVTLASAFTLVVTPVLLLPQLSFDNLLYPMSLVVLILLAFLLTNERGGLITAAIAGVCLVVDRGSAPPEQVFSGVLVLLGSAVISLLYTRFFNTARLEGVLQARGERGHLADVTTGLARQTYEQKGLEIALAESLQLIQNNYERFVGLGVYLINDTGLYAELAESIGVIRTSSQARFTVGDLSAIGQVTLTGQHQMYTEQAGRVNDIGATLLPGMTQQLVLPMRLGEEVIGALDLQGKEQQHISREDLQAFQSIADSLALVVNSARQIIAVQQRAEENARLAEQARNALAEVQRLNKRLIGRAWSDYLKENTLLSGQEYDSVTRTMQPMTTPSPYLQAAIEQSAPQVVGNVVAFPLRARGQVIGAIELELPEDVPFDRSQTDLLDEISDRFGLAMENVRLLEQSQRGVQRESLINVISTRIQSTTNVESMLAEAARSLSELLVTEHVTIRLGKPDRMQPSRVIEDMS